MRRKVSAGAVGPHCRQSEEWKVPVIATPVRRFPKALPANIACVQPGGGWVVRLEMAWGRVRRWWLCTFRPGYVAHMRSVRCGECFECTHEIIDARDLKLVSNVCGYWFTS